MWNVKKRIQYKLQKLLKIIKWIFGQDDYDDWGILFVTTLSSKWKSNICRMIYATWIIPFAAEIWKFHYFKMKDDMKTFMVYTPEFLVGTGIMIGSVFLPYALTHFNDLLAHPVPRPVFSSKRQKQFEPKFLLQIMKIGPIFAIFAIIFIVFSTIVFGINFTIIFFYQHLAKEVGGLLINFVYIFRYLGVIPTFGGAITGLYIIMYLMWKGIYMHRLVLDDLKNLHKFCKDNGNDKKYYNEGYQKTIEGHLQAIMDNMVDLRGFSKKMTKRCEVGVAIIFVSGIILCSGFFIFIVYVPTATKMLIVIKVLIACFFVLAGIIVFLPGYRNDESYDLQLRALLALDWYQWNKRNKEYYQIMLQMCQNPIQYRFIKDICINSKGMIKALRVMYTLCCIYIKLSNTII